MVDYYDTSKTYPCYGFGGKGADNIANHCFALNGNPQNPYVAGVDGTSCVTSLYSISVPPVTPLTHARTHTGILAAYYQALQHMKLSGPTIASQVINQAAAMASSRPLSQEQQHYTVLLILTDGVINDKEQTISAIVNASALPMSILILGVGCEDFREMDKVQQALAP